MARRLQQVQRDHGDVLETRPRNGLLPDKLKAGDGAGGSDRAEATGAPTEFEEGMQALNDALQRPEKCKRQASKLQRSQELRAVAVQPRQEGQVGHRCRHQELEACLPAPEVASLSDTELNQPGDAMLHYLPLLTELVELGAGLPSASSL